MHLFYTSKPFQYFDKCTNSMITTNNKIPIFINEKGILDNIVNEYLLIKTEYSWNAESNTPKTNSEHLLSFLDFCELNIQKDWSKISTNDINSYISFLTNNNNSERTVNVRITAISSLFKWSFDNKHIKNNPFEMYSSRNIKKNINNFINGNGVKTFNVSTVKNKIMKDAYTEEIPTEEEIKSFYSFLRKEDQLIALLLIESGLRKSELYQLTINMIKDAKESPSGKSFQVHLNSKTIRIKNNKSRYIVISKNMRVSLLKHIISTDNKVKRQKFYKKNGYETDLIFISSQGNKYSNDKLNKSFYKASILSGYYKKHEKSIHPHQLRHFYASNFIRNKEQDGTDMESAYMYLSSRLGHSSPDITKEFYVKIVNKIKQTESAEKFAEDFISGFLEDL